MFKLYAKDLHHCHPSTIKIDNNTAVAYINMGADYADTHFPYHVML